MIRPWNPEKQKRYIRDLFCNLLVKLHLKGTEELPKEYMDNEDSILNKNMRLTE